MQWLRISCTLRCRVSLENPVQPFQAFARRAGLPLFAALTLLGLAPARAEQVLCHYTYGGETKRLLAQAVASPYAVEGIKVGTYFRLRIVFQDKPADIASIKVYAYADRDDDPVLIHQATYPYPPPRPRAAPYGFSGLQSVYEPRREGELQYWCEMIAPAAKAAQ
jgi:hypothetical protein